MEAIHSDWSDWLPTAIAEYEPDGVALWYLGCNGFALKSSGGTTVFIDPYLGTGDPPRTIRMIPVPFDPADVDEADALLLTHEHSDHVHGASQAPILEGTEAMAYGPAASMDVVDSEGWTRHWDVQSQQLRTVEVGDSFDVGDFDITVGNANDPDAIEPVAYAIEHESGTFVHGGDARPGEFSELGEQFDVDVAALAFGTSGMIPDKETREPTQTTWYNDERMIIEAANELQAHTLVPTHWDMWKNLTADPTALFEHRRSFSFPKNIDIVEIGDRIDL